ncbi:phage baseplate assembly protein V [Actinacidiphila sp. ITFR-21]|uniref:phage baseplate assembly protein V n=1 Tax=Actinacidiphila sp. ITFR-21 TaxID=3075199 RepID=UPI00288BE7FB|nr:phage baseplate assembly protein V [Streptomyces sp. ITFR-21]WNI17612.1 phage baseplate assembly protein V [Streptomyces sp. ITFR-21]WNI17752.1 phage baseplate assembly protein V [Streptomyces sp. ITFR-21]
MNPLYGTYSAIVVSAQDPQNRGRVRLQIPQIMGTAVSGWAEPASIGSALPGDQVFVTFDGGDRSHPLYWPRMRSAAPGVWTPLALEPGWVASSAGSPVYRTTQDGMVELSGSVETSTAIGLGVVVKFASLPATARPVERHRATTATTYRTAYNSKTTYGEYRTTTTTTSATYVTDANGPSVSFIAPASGQAVVVFGAFMQNTTDAGRCLMGVRVLQGATILADGDDNRSAESQGPDNVSASNSRQITGMTPGTTYTVTALYRTEGASSSAAFDNKWIVVIPVGPHDTPAARITMETNGDLQALFPGGAAPAYDMSLTGIRARIL